MTMSQGSIAKSPTISGGWTRRQLGSGLLALATVVLIVRLPGSVILIAVAPVVSLFLTGLHRPPIRARWLWAFLICAVSSGMVAVFINPVGLSLVNFFTLALVFTLFAAAILASGDASRVAEVVMKAIYWSFALALTVGLLEMASGFRLQKVLYPNGTDLTVGGKFVVAAWFPNYNDFAVVITMFGLMVLVRILFTPSTAPVQTFRIAIFFVAVVVILIGGSRGALVGLLLGTLLVLIHAIRMLRPKLISAPSIIMGTLAAGAGATLLWASPWVQDNSTSIRGRIIADTLRITPGDTPRFWFGWGDIGRFTTAAKQAYPGVLMDPHNILLEVFTWFGLPTVLLLLVLWIYVCWKALWRLEIRRNWMATSALILFAVFPILGIVPSASLRYYHVFLIAPCVIAFLIPQSDHKIQEPQ